MEGGRGYWMGVPAPSFSGGIAWAPGCWSSVSALGSRIHRARTWPQPVASCMLPCGNPLTFIDLNVPSIVSWPDRRLGLRL